MILYLAGAETHWKMMLECGVRNQLYSFFHMRTMRAKAFTEMVNALQEEKDRRDEAGEPQLRLFLDSGASTYVASKGKKPDSQTYFREYKECLARTKELWHCVSEVYLDDSKLFDLNQAYRWREELLALHSQVLPVWHLGRRQTSWDSYCLDPRYPYIAFGPGLDVGTKDRLCHFARVAGKQVHAMSETKLRTDMMYLQADSYSSVLWTSSAKYGSLYVFHGNQLRLIEKKNKQDRKLFKRYFEASGIDFAQLMADDPYTVNKCSLIAWRNMAARLEQQGDRRNGRCNEKGNNATDAGRDRSAKDTRQRYGSAHVAGKPNVGQSTGEFQGTAVRGSDSVQGSSVAGAKRSFGLRRVLSDTENAQGVNHVKRHNDQEIYSVGQGREEVVGGRDQRREIHVYANGESVRQSNKRPSISSGAEIVGQDGGHNRDSALVLDATHMKTRWILDSKLGRLVPKTDFAGLGNVKLLHTQADIESDPRYKEHLAALTVPASSDVVSYPQDIEDDVNTLSANMPKTVCDNCAISGECKEYQPGSTCFFDDDFGKLPIRNLDANLAEREVLLKFDRTRLMRAIMAERVSAGGALDGRVSQAMDDYIRRKNDFVALANKRNTTPVTASVTARGKPGIFSQLFGAGMPTGKREEGDTEIPLNEPAQSDGDVEITMTVTKDVPSKK